MAERPSAEHTMHMDEDQLKHGWQSMGQMRSTLTRADQQLLQEALGALCHKKAVATSSASAAIASDACPASDKADKAIRRAASQWLRSWLSRYGLAMLLAIYVILDRAEVFRILSCQQVCLHSAHAQESLLPRDASRDVISQMVLPDSKHSDHRHLQSFERLLGETEPSSSSSSSSSSSAGGHANHPHEAMFFLILALITGTFVTHMLSLPLFKGLQQTVILFVAGVLLSIILEGFELADKTDVLGRSYNMWMDIDPHLLLFTLLPPLVTGDAMGIDTTVAKRVAKQCFFLAGPGVCMAGFACAGFLQLYLPYDWPFLLCLTTGSILCATDPVAVVALLKELGASPTLRVQIQGESLLNDGTAIVLYTIAYNMLSGEEYDVGDIIMFLVKMAIYAWGLGMVIGFVFYKWIKMANNKLNHNSAVIQVALTICCAYSSFIIAEGGFHISGVLSTVAAAGVLAHKMWPEVVCKESMETIWHMLEYLGNTVIFFLAGTLTGKVMVRIDPVDYLHLCSIYIAVLVIRGCLFFGFRPLFKYLHSQRCPVTKGEAAVMAWGGLRGAIGLALAIQVNVGRANDRISQEDADRVLFYVSGIAALTLCINATTCPALVRKLGVTSLPATKRIMLSILNRRLLEHSRSNTKPGRVREALSEILDEVEEHIQAPQKRFDHAKEHWKQGVKLIRYGKVINAMMAEPIADSQPVGMMHAVKKHLEKRGTCCGDTDDILARIKQHTAKEQEKAQRQIALQSTGLLLGKEGNTDIEDKHVLLDGFRLARQNHQSLPAEKLALKMISQDLIHMPLQELQDDMMKLVQYVEPDIKISKAVNQAFLAIVRSEYWRMIEHGDFFGNQAEQVLGSVTEALSANSNDVNDFAYIEPFIQCEFATSSGRMSLAFAAARSRKHSEVVVASRLHAFLESPIFIGAIAAVIVANSLLTLVEQKIGPEEGERKDVGWVILEIFFSIVFLIEFILKCCHMRLQYFMDASNCFDFTLVILGIVGCILTLMLFLEEEDSPGEASSVPGSETRLVRVVQVFRMMRIIRLFRLYRFMRSLKTAWFSRKGTRCLDVAERMQKISILLNFSRAHVKSQEKMVRFFGRGSQVDMCEVARCILQSQVSVYKALTMAETETRDLNMAYLNECSIAGENRAVAEDCEKFILNAQSDGIITNHEAEEFLSTIHHHISMCQYRIRETHAGICTLSNGLHVQSTEPSSPVPCSPAESSPLRSDEPEIGYGTREKSPGPPETRLVEEESQVATGSPVSSKQDDPSDSTSSPQEPPPVTMGRQATESDNTLKAPKEGETGFAPKESSRSARSPKPKARTKKPSPCQGSASIPVSGVEREVAEPSRHTLAVDKRGKDGTSTRSKAKKPG